MERAAVWGFALFLAACDPPKPPLLTPSSAPAVLPAGAARHRCTSVYDGDTLTLEGGQKVRLLAVDTPELKEHENLAPEARDFTRRLCQGKEIWLEFDTEREDRYGRWLCYVYAAEGGPPAMVNAELLRQGLARFYTPGANLKYADRLLACQREARENGRGTWKDYVLGGPKAVVATRSGHAYHRADCREIQASKGLRTIDEKEAIDAGLSRCRTCKP